MHNTTQGVFCTHYNTQSGCILYTIQHRIYSVHNTTRGVFKAVLYDHASKKDMPPEFVSCALETHSNQLPVYFHTPFKDLQHRMYSVHNTTQDIHSAAKQYNVTLSAYASDKAERRPGNEASK